MRVVLPPPVSATITAWTADTAGMFRWLDITLDPVPQSDGYWMERLGSSWDRRTRERRQHYRLNRPGRRQSDRRVSAAESRRVVLVAPDGAWRHVAAYLFGEAGYAVYAAGDRRQAGASTTRLLPDVVVVNLEVPEMLRVLAQLTAGSSTGDIPIVVLTSSLHSADARLARAAGGVPLLAQTDDIDLLVGEVDTLIDGAARARRALKRRLVELQEVARYYRPDPEGQARLRQLIDRLQVAIFAVDEHGQCIAASDGATILTGYSRQQLLTTSVFQAGFAGGRVSHERWRGFLANRHYAGITTITNRAGADVPVHAAAVAEILPGLHVAAFAPA
jgi:PAS domain S-box-containing protein